MEILKKEDYEKALAASRDRRMKWWREARFGMFVHFGLYSVIGRHEWVMSMEGIDKEEYEKYADMFRLISFCLRKAAARNGLNWPRQPA